MGSYPEAVYEVERKLIEGFGKNPHFKAAFFTNHDLAVKTLDQMAYTYDTNGHGKGAAHEEPLEFDHPAPIQPGHHGYACGPQCYCLRFQDAALTAKAEKPDEWEHNFATKTKDAAN